MKTNLARLAALGLLPLLCLATAPARGQTAASNDVCLSDLKCSELNDAANNLAKAGQFDAALALYQTAYAARPAAWLLVNIGRMQQKLGRLPAAINSYRQFLASLETTNDPVMTQRVQEYLAQAESTVVDVCLSNPKCAELNETARSLSKAGNLDAALALYQTAYAKYPTPWLLVNIGRMQQKLDRLPAAIESYRKYLASAEAKDDPELTKRAQDYLLQAEGEFEPPPAPLAPEPPPPPPPICPVDSEDAPGAAKTSRQKPHGFVVALGLGSRRPVVQLDATTTLPASSVGGSLALGYKVGRVLFGLGVEIDYFASSTQVVSPAGSSSISASTTSYLVVPGLQVALVRAASDRFELLASLQVGLGRAVNSVVHDPAVPSPELVDVPTSNFHLNYQIGPGLRYYVLKPFALTLVGGIAGDHFFATQDGASGLRADTLSSISLFGTLGALGIF